MRKIRIYQVDAFTTEKFRGNPAGVVPDADGLSDEDMRRIARELNNSETAFLLPPTSSDHDVWIRFFTPTTEVPSCGHATIAAHYIRALENDLDTCTVIQKTGAGVLPVDVVKEDGGYKIVITQRPVEFGEPFDTATSREIMSAIGVDAADLDERFPIQVVSTGHSKVLVALRSATVLDSLRPDLSRLIDISRRIECDGYYAFTVFAQGKGDRSAGPVTPERGAGILARGRMFAPAIGIPEDPVTGNANGPLGAYLVRHGLAETSDGWFSFRASQGDAMGRPGVVEVTVAHEGGMPYEVLVGGPAVTVFTAEIEL
jgi:PhzF family phenazine biosynthesis protein